MTFPNTSKMEPILKNQVKLILKRKGLGLSLIKHSKYDINNRFENLDEFQHRPSQLTEPGMMIEDVQKVAAKQYL